MGTDALIQIGMFIAAFGIAGVACWLGDRRLKAKQQDWTGESGSRGVR